MNSTTDRAGSRVRNFAAGNGPFAVGALALFNDGPGPLPAKGKNVILDGHHGRVSRRTGKPTTFPTSAEVSEWVRRYGNLNIAARIPRNIIGLDVDDYPGHAGAATLSSLKMELGPLPPTVLSTARWNGTRPLGANGIRWFRIPDAYLDMDWPGAAGPGIEILWYYNRYAIVPPSRHPDTGDWYRWFDESGGIELEWPEFSEIPELPEAWCEHLVNGSHASSAPRSGVMWSGDTAEWLRKYAGGDPCAHMQDVFEEWTDKMVSASGTGGLHDATLRAVNAVIGECVLGHTGASHALAQAQPLFMDGIATRDRKRKSDAAGEWQSLVSGAIQNKMREHRGRVAESDPCADLDELNAIQPVVKNGRNLPDEFWGSSDALEHIRQAAHSRGRSADAVLGAVLARMSAMVPVELRFDASLGPGVLTLYVILCGSPETGKGTSADVGDELLPEHAVPVHGRFNDMVPLGSGEGIAEAFYDSVNDGNGRAKSVRKRVYNHVFFFEDEGSKLIKVMARPGGIVAEVIRSAWSGKDFGQQNASAQTTRKIKKGSYSLGMLIGFQPGTIGELLSREQALAGTPQRFLYLSATDPSVPRTRAEKPDWPDTLDMEWPEGITIPDSVCDEVWESNASVSAGESETELYMAHMYFMRLRVSVMLAILDGRGEVTEDDWEWSRVVWDTSCAVRDSMIKHGKEEAKRAEADKREVMAERAVHVDTVKERHSALLMQAVGIAARHIQRQKCDGGCKKRCITRSIPSKVQKPIDMDIMFARLVAEGYAKEANDDGVYAPGKVRAT